jgi:hypothetical protein
MTMKHCPSCKRNVDTEHSWNTVVLVVLLIFFLIPGLIYLAWKWKRRCPICHTPEKMLTAPKFDDQAVSPGAFP